MNVTTIGIDLAKNVFSIHGVDSHGKVVVRKRLNRSKLLPLIAQLPPCLIGMEACSGAHYWAREFSKLGHDARIIAPRFVAPYRKSSKNDDNDAEAICEAVSRPSMRFVPVKTAEQQAVLCLHRIRSGLTKERTAQINQIRGLLAEFGLVMPKGRYSARHYLPEILEDGENGLPMLARRLLHNIHQRIRQLDEEILAYDREIEAMARRDEQAKRLMTVPGIGPQTATAILASAPDPRQFKSGRHFAAWLGLVPRQYSTGGKVRLGRITKRGDKYLRMLLIHGTRAVIAKLGEKEDQLSRWARDLVERRGYKRAAVALAAKNARIIWAMMAHQTEFKAQQLEA
ncbi:IS110 family transposase [Marinobacter salinisoli]|uniref:IS110 family transposase n=1 Tax=Marinobacter salinisoli TaxID=2769486 RepID=A0ABX7MPW5_9GAMM|nr:IS110 family transposase [Marinobacter salinisoli]QSP94189.1 IS110 family transposase [Marinobacter salinisoli]